MERKFYERVLRCTPDGIQAVDSTCLREMVSECENEVSQTSSVKQQILLYLNLAETAYKTGHPHTAVRYYRKVINLALDADYKSLQHRHKDFAVKAASGLMKAYRRHFPHEKFDDELKVLLSHYYDIYLLARNK